jgi:hypothetical protein
MDTGKLTWGPGWLATVPQETWTLTGTYGPGAAPHCRVFWGSHGCQHPRGHPPEDPHSCDCCECPDEACKPVLRG